MPRRLSFIVSLSLALPALAGPTLAHSGDGLTGGFLHGLSHPISGFDHVVAMIAVGLWGAFLGPPAIWLLPIVFPLVMSVGSIVGMLGIQVILLR